MASELRPFKLLVSARDAGSAGHIHAILDEAGLHPWLETKTYAEGPAFDQLGASGLPIERFSLPATVPGGCPEVSRRLIAEARRVIETEAPDAVLVGVSHCHEAGLDEAILAAAFDRPRFAMQDFWGDVNLTLGAAADLYFALDDVAVRLTESRHKRPAVAYGSPKHARYRTLDVIALRGKHRTELGVRPDQPLIGYFGQSLFHLPGYRSLVEAFARAVSQGEDDVQLIYRPHPRESEQEITETLGAFAGAGVSARLATGGTTEAWLATVDVVASCFSSCAYDAAFINRSAPVPVCSAIYLLFDDTVAEYFRRVAGVNHPPPAELGLVASVTRGEALGESLREAFSERRRLETWRRSHERLPALENPAREILLDIRRRTASPQARRFEAGSGS